jgi:hypothetical protein
VLAPEELSAIQQRRMGDQHITKFTLGLADAVNTASMFEQDSLRTGVVLVTPVSSGFFIFLFAFVFHYFI